MKILSKTYLLIGILITVAGINLFLLYQGDSSDTSQSNAVIKTGDIKVAGEAISALAISVANGNENDKEELEEKLQHTENDIRTLRNGGTVHGGLHVARIPSSFVSEYDKVTESWNKFSESTYKVKDTPVFDPTATSSINYVLQKNGELVLLTNDLAKELQSLDRDFNRHKQIAQELKEYSNEIGQITLLISIGEGENTHEKLKENRMKLDIGIRKLLNISTQDIDVKSVGEEHEELIPIPRENSESLRKIDPLWEAMKLRIMTLEETALLSPEFSMAKEDMSSHKEELGKNIDKILELWNQEFAKQGSEEQTIIQILLGIDIVVFIFVIFIIRQSLSPLQSITQGLSKIKEGRYGEKLEYKSSDEVGELVDTFNVMSDTIKEKEEEARKTDVAKDEFLAMITHELKTPLVPIQGYSDILLGEHLGKLTDKQKERISIIKSSSETLLSIISDLLDAQKLELGQLRMKKQETNIKETIQKTIEEMNPYAQQKNVEISSTLFDLTINHDPERISQVVSNLIKNSITATEGIQGKVEVSMEDLPSELKINIKDNGIGIPLEKQKDLFKKFYQVDATLTREKGGSGLGLAICKGIIDNHNGTISVQSNANQGAVFSFTLPKGSESKSPIGIA